MKIATITEDGKTISQHFGRALNYMVVTVEDGKITHRELRSKLGHGQFESENHDQHSDGAGRHGYGPAADHRHGQMAASISDCEALLCGGMGRGAYENLNIRHIRPVITDLIDIDEAVLAYVRGDIVDHIEKLH
ncbi:MAG: hypothetical protein A2Y54_02055 [Chloroflexi bacterium RBG_16_51_16]|nr:MAG: hypothetical protein A2Y54_02055 [Chloroflexi bacterium RBG_16_51_16]